jgi:hypothetical protein
MTLFPRRTTAFVSSLFVLVACGSDRQRPAGPARVVPELGTDASRRFAVVGTEADGLDVPRDLEFDPEHPDQLWVINRGYDGVVIYTNAGSPGQTAERRVDAFSGHFMAAPSSLAFGVANRFASCQESRDDWDNGPQPEDDYMGPTLWLADLDVFAVLGQTYPYDGRYEGSHIDMLHESPLCMGIEHDHDNVYWVFDGLHGHVVYYDFVKDHGPGGTNHMDGIVRRYPEATLLRVAGVPGHLALDHQTGWLYIADTGRGTLMRLDSKSGQPRRSPTILQKELLAEYTEMSDVTVEVIAQGLDEPSGVALAGGRLFVTEHGSGDIVAFDTAGKELGRAATGAVELMGLTLGPDGKLWYVDGSASTVVRVDPDG